MEGCSRNNFNDVKVINVEGRKTKRNCSRLKEKQSHEGEVQDTGYESWVFLLGRTAKSLGSEVRW